MTLNCRTLGLLVLLTCGCGDKDADSGDQSGVGDTGSSDGTDSGDATADGTDDTEGETYTAGDASMTVPEGAAEDGVEPDISEGAVPETMPTDHAVSGDIYALTPHGATFSLPVEVRLPLDTSLSDPVVIKLDGPSDTTWEEIPFSIDGDEVVFEVSSFSYVASATSWSGSRDADGDGFTVKEDCDDSDASVNPLATEVCDGVDNDCDGDVDEFATGASTWYADTDGDTYGDPSRSLVECTLPSGYVANNTDCDDGDASTNPGAAEVCDAADNDCNGDIDDNARDAVTWYLDADGDGYGVPSSTTAACQNPVGYAATDDDCDDGNAKVNPGATEVTNGIDDDCNGTID